MMQTNSLLMATVLGISSWALANSQAVFYEQDSQRKKELFHYQLEEMPVEGGFHLKGTVRDLEGQTVYEESADLKGIEIQKDIIDQKQTGQKAVVEVRDGKVFFSKSTDGKTSVKEEALDGSFVMTSNFRFFVHSHWAELTSGKKVPIRFGVWERQETVGFDIFQTGEEKVRGRTDCSEVIVLKMKPSSFIIAALVKPIIFKFTKDGSKIIEMNGRVAPKQKVGSSFKDLDADVVYSDAPSTAPASAPAPTL